MTYQHITGGTAACPWSASGRLLPVCEEQQSTVDSSGRDPTHASPQCGKYLYTFILMMIFFTANVAPVSL